MGFSSDNLKKIKKKRNQYKSKCIFFFLLLVIFPSDLSYFKKKMKDETKKWYNPMEMFTKGVGWFYGVENPE